MWPEMKFRESFLLVMCVASFGLSGCEERQMTYFEVKRIDEPLTINDLSLIVNILETLPPDQLKLLPPIFAKIPTWEPNRTLSISSLTREELERMNTLWSYEHLSRRFEKNRHLHKLLFHYGLNLEQLLGLVRSVGVAIASTYVEPEYDYKLNIKRAQDRIYKLEADDRPFANLSPDKQFEVEHMARYLSRRDRCEQLAMVPDSNKALVTEYFKDLREVLPVDYFQDPLAPVTDWQEEYGVPFQELNDRVPSDASIMWRKEDKLIHP